MPSVRLLQRSFASISHFKNWFAASSTSLSAFFQGDMNMVDLHAINIPIGQISDLYPNQWSNFWREKTWQVMRSWGLNYVYLMWRGGNTYPSTYAPPWQLFDQAVEWGRRNGMRTNLMYEESRYSPSPLYMEPQPVDLAKYLEMWKFMATYFKGNPDVDFGTFTEPHAISLTRWHDVHQQACDAIWSKDSARKIYVDPLSYVSGGYSWGSMKSVLDAPLTDPNNLIVYEPHLFSKSDPVAAFGNTVDGIKNCLRAYKWYDALTQGYRIFCGQTGARLTNVPFETTWLQNFLKVCKELGIGYTVWAMQHLVSVTAAPYALVQDFINYAPTLSGQILKDAQTKAALTINTNAPVPISFRLERV